MTPRFSIVIPTIGRLGLLERALASALDQRDLVDDYEVVVLDNCSADGTWEYLQGVASSRLRIVRNARRLPQAENWNTAVRLCRGEFIHVLQDDNIVLPHMLATVSRGMAQHEGVELTYFPARYMDEDDRVLADHTPIWRPKHEQLLPAPQGLMRFAREYTVAASFLMFARAVFDRHGGFDEEGPSYPFFLDIEFVLRWMGHHDTLVLPECLALHRMWSGSRTTAEVWTPEVFTSTCYMVNRVFCAAADSGRLDADDLDELRQALVKTFLLDLFDDFAAARRELASADAASSPSTAE